MFVKALSGLDKARLRGAYEWFLRSYAPKTTVPSGLPIEDYMGEVESAVADAVDNAVERTLERNPKIGEAMER